VIVDIAGGAVISCDDLGNPSHPAVILTGGLATQRTVWPNSLCTGLFDAGYRIIRFDNRDTGESTWSKEPSGVDLLRMVQSGFGPNDQFAYTIDDLADDIVALMDALKIERAHVVGMSLGGRIAQAAAMRHPQRTAALVSMMSTTGNPELPSITPAAMTALTTPLRDPFDVAAVTELAQ
jgi:pimeloyl-ACP methyl ester carboxylesterase